MRCFHSASNDSVSHRSRKELETGDHKDRVKYCLYLPEESQLGLQGMFSGNWSLNVLKEKYVCVWERREETKQSSVLHAGILGCQQNLQAEGEL